ncbi:MAG TPA: hypothetical protein VGM86_23725 [Thermoanaerobaculia bacterium]
MRLRSIALLLLLALGLRLGAGPHPCHATAAPVSAMAHASCHQGSQPKAPVPGDEDCCKGGDALCEHACQTAAVFQVTLQTPALLAFQEQAAALEHRAKPLVAFPIDHVPLV